MRYLDRTLRIIIIGVIISGFYIILSLPRWNDGPPPPRLLNSGIFKSIIGALSMYHQDFGFFPKEMTALIGRNPQRRVYIKPEYVSKGKFSDAWGNPIVIIIDPKEKWVKLISYGANGKKDIAGDTNNDDLVKNYYRIDNGNWAEATNSN